MAGVDFSILPQQLVNGLLLGAIYALIALGYTMVYGVLRLINFAHGEVFMLGAYAALFTSWFLGFTPDALRGGVDKPSSWIVLALMLIVSMIVCGLIGVLIERLAYRPMRNQPRIASLITAIGVSLFLQYAGGLFLPQSPPPAISEQVNPYRRESDNVRIVIKDAPEALRLEASQLAEKAAAAETAYRAAEKLDPPRTVSPETQRLKDEFQTLLRDSQQKDGDVRRNSVLINIPFGQLIMFVTTLLLMLVLRHIVLKTKTGRAMRAVSHDFDSASLMGINVNNTVTVTFLIGSALAGAGAMMYATFLRTNLTPFLGVTPGVKAFVAAVLGGIGNIPGAVLGGLLMGVVETLVVWGGYSGYKDAVAFVVLIAVLLFRPGGLLGSSKVEKV